MVGIILSIIVAGFGLFGSSISVVGMFVTVDDAEKIVVTMSDMVKVAGCLLILCLGIAALIHFVKEKKAEEPSDWSRSIANGSLGLLSCCWRYALP